MSMEKTVTINSRNGNERYEVEKEKKRNER